MEQKFALPEFSEMTANFNDFHNVLGMTETISREMSENLIERRKRERDLREAQLRTVEAVMRPVSHIVNNFLQRLMIIRYEIEENGTLSDSVMKKLEADIANVAGQIAQLSYIDNPWEPGAFRRFFP